MKIIVNNIMFYLCLFYISSCNNGNVNDIQVVNNNINYDVVSNINADSILHIAIKIIGSNNQGQSSLRYNQSREGYAEAVDYYINKAAQDIYINSCDSIIYPNSYHFENNYNVVDYDVINVFFDLSGSEYCSTTFVFFNNKKGSPFKHLLDNI